MTMKHIIIASLALVTSIAAATETPYRAELDDAAIAVPSLDNILENGLLLGNGDLNGLLYSDKDRLVLRITKNDVWDARLLTENDPPLPTLKRLKELGKESWPDRNWILPADVKVTRDSNFPVFPQAFS